MSKGTARRSVRIEDGLWEEAQAAASDRGDNLSEVIRNGLWQYVHYHVDERTEYGEEHVRGEAPKELF